MAKNPKKTTPTTTTTITPANFNQVLKAVTGLGANPLGTVTSGTGSTGSTTNPGVPTTQAGDTVAWQNAGDTPFTGLPSDIQKLLTSGANGSKEISYNSAVTLLKLAASDRGLLVEIQNDLRSAGYITPSQKVTYGTLDKVTENAWKTLVQTSINSNTSITKALTTNGGSPGYAAYQYALQQKYQAAVDASASVSAPMLTLSDPNKIAQAFASAMESIGAGAPSAAQVSKFVDAFHQSEISAVQDAYSTQKSDYLAGARNDLQQLQAVQGGPPQAPTPVMETPARGANAFAPAPPEPTVSPAAQSKFNTEMGQFNNQLNQTGPVTVATKAMPNLDAEAMAAAKQADPSQYYANQFSYYGAILDQMLSGNMPGQTQATAPSQSGLGGAIVTAPAIGAM